MLPSFPVFSKGGRGYQPPRPCPPVPTGFTTVALSGSCCPIGIPLIPPPMPATPLTPFYFLKVGGIRLTPPPTCGEGGGGAPPLACQRFPVDLRGNYDGVLVFRQVAPLHPLFVFWRWGGPPLPPPSPSGSLRPPCRIRAGSGSSGVIV